MLICEYRLFFPVKRQHTKPLLFIKHDSPTNHPFQETIIPLLFSVQKAQTIQDEQDYDVLYDSIVPELLIITLTNLFEKSPLGFLTHHVSPINILETELTVTAIQIQF